MPADTTFAEIITRAILSRGGRVLESQLENPPNPFPYSFELNGRVYRALIYVRRTTRQEGIGTDHGRPEGEWHMQMVFDDSVRGAGVRNQLRSRTGYTTVLLGYTDALGETVIAAWDPGRKADYAYSRSLQVTADTLQSAIRSGLSQQTVRDDETVVAFRPESFPEYLEKFSTVHSRP